MSEIGPELDQVMRRSIPADSVHYQNLRATIEASPVLRDTMNQAAMHKQLQHFAWMPENTNAGATYDPSSQTIHLKGSDVATADPAKRNTLTFILGHELKHGLNAGRTQQAREQFAKEIGAMHGSGTERPNDYSAPVKAMLKANRVDEATAHIAGWNALVSRIKKENPEATLLDVATSGVGYVSTDFLQGVRNKDGAVGYALRPGMHLNKDLSMTADARNIEAVAKHYFEKAPNQTKLGARGNSDYTNYYATSLISQVCRTEMANPSRAGELRLDMKGLKLKESLLEENGIWLGQGDARCVYRDTHSPKVVRHFDHTYESHTHVPERGAKPVTQGREAEAHAAPRASIALNAREHPGHSLFQQAQAGMRQLDADHGRAPDQRTDNAAAYLAVHALRHGLTGIDHVALGSTPDKLIVAQGTPGSPLARVAVVPTLDALNTPVEASSRAWTDTVHQVDLRSAAQHPPMQAANQQEAALPGMGIGR